MYPCLPGLSALPCAACLDKRAGGLCQIGLGQTAFGLRCGEREYFDGEAWIRQMYADVVNSKQQV